MGRYESGKLTEEVLCQPAREYFRPSQDVCNLTVANGGTSWYCEKPKNKFLLCEDWMSVAAPSGTVIFNDAEKEYTASSSLWDARSFRFVNEPRCEKTGLRGFRPGLTQTRL